MPVEGTIPHMPGIEMYGNSIPAGTVGGDLFEYINFEQRYDLDAGIQRAKTRVEKGDFGFVDVYKARMNGMRRLVCEMTLRNGLVVYELNGLSRDSWERLGKYGSQGDARWDGTHEDAKPKP